MNFSFFNFHDIQDLDVFKDKLISHVPITKNSERYNNEPLTSRVNVLEDRPLSDICELHMNAERVRYIIFEASTERVKDFSNWFTSDNILKAREDRVVPLTVKILAFQIENQIICAVFSGIQSAKIIIGNCFPHENWGQTSPIDSGVTEDTLYWIFKRHIDSPRENLSRQNRLYITSLESYMGKTRDQVHAVRAEGIRISTILGTLAFLFNNEELKSIRPAIQFGNEKVLIELTLTGTMKTWPLHYTGPAFQHLVGLEKEIALIIFIYHKIIPNIILSYNDHIQSNSWSPQLKVDFIRRLGNIITEKVNEVLVSLEPSEERDHEDSNEDDFELELEEETD